MKYKIDKIAKTKLKGAILWLTLAMFVVSVVVFTVETATSGARLAKLEKLLKDLASENAELSNGLIEASSLSSVEGKSLELGFSTPQKIIYIGREEGFAKLPNIP